MDGYLGLPLERLGLTGPCFRSGGRGQLTASRLHAQNPVCQRQTGGAVGYQNHRALVQYFVTLFDKTVLTLRIEHGCRFVED